MSFNYNLRPDKNINQNEYDINYDNPVITIVTAYYNGDKYIDETIRSVLNQTFSEWEWLIVNDGSTSEESIEKLKEIEKIDKRIKVLNKKNGGLAETRDYGAERASKSSKYLIFIDDDDLINNTYLECAYWTLETNIDATWAYTDLANFEGEEYIWRKDFDSDIEQKENLLVATALIRKEDFFEVKGYELREKAVNEDWNLWLKLIAKGKYPVRMDFVGFWYRRKKASESELAKSKDNKERAMEIIQNTAKTITEKVEAIQFPKSEYNWNEIVEKVDSIVVPKRKKDEKTKILMIIPWMTTGGADKFNLDLISRIDKEKFDFIILTSQPNVNNWRQDFEQHAIIYDLTTFINRKYWIAFVNYIIEKERIDIIFNTNSTFGYSALPYLKAKYPEIPIMDYIHMEEWYNRNGGYSRDSSTISSVIDKTLVCNKNSENILIDYFKRDKKDIETVYIGVDEKKFDAKNYNKEEILEKLEINPKGKKIISFIARIDLQKRPHLLMNIIKELKKKRNDFIFVIAGDGPMLQKIKIDAKKYNIIKDVIFLGNVSNTAEIYKISDLTINCSIKEGLALTAYESLSMGVPVVSADVGGQKELINDNVGKIVPCLQKETEVADFNYSDEEINNYVVAVEEVLDNLDYYKGNCRKRILDGFTIDYMVERMSEIFTEIKNNPNKTKIEKARNLSDHIDVTKEMITKFFVLSNNEFEWLADNVNTEFFNSADGGYDYFKTPRGKLRLLLIAITQKLHIYNLIKRIMGKE